MSFRDTVIVLALALLVIASFVGWTYEHRLRNDQQVRLVGTRSELTDLRNERDELRAKLDAASAAASAIDIDFDALSLDMNPESQFTYSTLTDRVRQLLGRRVRISGYIYAGNLLEPENIRELLLIRQVPQGFGARLPADQVILVRLRKETRYRTRPITVEGNLFVEPFDGTDGDTRLVFRLAEAEVVERAGVDHANSSPTSSSHPGIAAPKSSDPES